MKYWQGMSRLLVGLIALWMLQANAIPTAWDQPGNEWLTRTSAHFDLHYPAGYDDMAQHALNIAERVHDELVPFFGQEPRERTQMVLVDDYDYSNGWATPFPFVQIRLFASPPEDVSGLEHMDEWLHGLIRHEYVHILHMNLAAGVPAAGRNVFGRMPLLFPHVFTPSFFTEGLAVYLETNHQLGYGRLDGSFYEMEMRTELLDHAGDDLNQVIVPLRDWPLGKNYLYGAYFWQYIAQTYGEQAISRYLNKYSRQIIPWIMQNHVARGVFGKSFPLLWNDYRNWLIQRFVRSGEVLQASAVAGEALPVLADRRQVITARGAQLLQLRNNGEDRPQLLRWQHGAAGWSAQTLTSASGVTDMDMAEDGTLVAARLLNHADGRDLDDLFLWSEDNGWQRLTDNMRLRKVRWLADGQQLIASRKLHGLSELWLLDRHGGQQRLWQGSSNTVLGDFDVSADGQWLVAAVKRPQQGWNLERMNLASRQWQALTDTRATENSPVCLPDGRVLFSADYDGVYNLYVLAPDSGRLEQWTRVVGGAFSPRWLNGELVYQQYTAQGYQLMSLTPEPLQVLSLASLQGRYNYPQAVTADVASETHDYSPWPTLAPTWWWPVVEMTDYSSSVGLATSGNDAVGRHAYSLTASWDFRQNWADFSGLYQYDTRWLLLWNRTHSYHDLNLNVDDDYLAVREDLLTLQRDHLWDAAEDHLQLHLGLTADHEKVIRSPALVTTGSGYEETLAGVALTFDNRELYRNVPGIGWGTYADLVYESNDVLASDFDGGQWQASMKHTFDLPGRRTLALGLAGGYADRGAEPFVIGGMNGEEILLFGRDEFSLPGYDRAIQIGHKYYNSVLRYNQFLVRTERNWGMIPLGLGDWSAGIWVQSASAWFREQHRPQLTSVGAELGVDLVLGYALPLPLRIGVAQGLDADVGITEGYLRLEAAF